MCGVPEHAGHVFECGRRPGPGTPSRLGRREKSQESTRPQKSRLWCHQVVRLPSALMGFLCACGKGEAAATVIRWEASDNYLIHFRKDGSPRRKKELKTRHRDGMMWPSQCGVAWETTKPPKRYSIQLEAICFPPCDQKLALRAQGLWEEGTPPDWPQSTVTPSLTPLVLLVWKEKGRSLSPSTNGSKRKQQDKFSSPTCPSAPNTPTQQTGTLLLLFHISVGILSLACSGHCVSCAHSPFHQSLIPGRDHHHLLTGKTPEAQRVQVIHPRSQSQNSIQVRQTQKFTFFHLCG